MGVLNPIQMLAMLRNSSPQQVAEQIINENYSNDSTMQQLLQMGRNGDEQGLQNYARQLFQQQGRDFDNEMTSLLSLMGQR